MEGKVLGIHHITAIAGYAKRNYDFYTRVLALRFIKKTVNFDDPKTYHFYFGDKVGSPGTILTFFPWEGVARGKQGAGMPTEIGYTIPEGSLEFWDERLKGYYVRVIGSGVRFGEKYLTFEDPDGLPISLVIPKSPDPRDAWETTEVGANVAIRGFHSITLTLNKIKETADLLTGVFDYEFVGQEGNRFRYRTSNFDTANIVDLIEDPSGIRTGNGGGIIHHVAFRVKDEKVLMEFREKVLASGLDITPKKDRNYFLSLYFREPGGVLFEIATDTPGFAVDEDVSNLGKKLMLPSQFESHRKEIEAVLPALA